MANVIRPSILAMGTLADRLKERCAELGISQADLVRATGAKGSSVNKWFSGDTKNLKGKNLVLAAQKLEVSEAWLADGAGPKERKFVGGTLLTIPKERYDLLTETQKRAIEEWIDNQIASYTGVTRDFKSSQAA